MDLCVVVIVGTRCYRAASMLTGSNLKLELGCNLKLEQNAVELILVNGFLFGVL